MNWNWQSVPEGLEERLETGPQKDMLAMLRSGMTQRAIATQIGISEKNVQAMGSRIKARLRAIGYDPDNGMKLVSPTPQILKGRTAFVRVDAATGEERVSHYHNKTDIDKQRQLEAIREAIVSSADSIKPFKAVRSPKYVMADLCTVYTLTDFHLGMYSWEPETGADWDMDIAERVMLNAFSDMMLGSPDSEIAIFAQLGDLLHWDGLLALTPTAKNVLDADTRFPLLVQTAIDICAEAVEMLLHKHERVHVLMAEGNHDMASSVWLRAVMAKLFKNNDRVTVDVSPFPFYSFKWGETFLGWHHGHLQKMDNLPLLFATDPRFRAEYGQCRFTYIHTGHMHHQKVIDKGGIVVEQHPTLSARDAHGARGFLMSNRETKAITYHKQHGEKSRITVRPNAQEAA
jgi:hypothetical protein